MNQLFINGKDVTDDVNNFDDFTIEVGLNENTTIVRKLSERFRFENDTETYTLLKNTFFSSCNGLENTLEGLFKSDVCDGVILPLTIIVSDSVFSEQYIEVLMTSDSSEDQAYNYLDSTYWFDHNFGSAYEIPIMYFTVQPSFLMWVLLLMLMPLRIVLNTLDEILSDICKGVTFFIGKCDVNISSLVFSKLDNWILGVGRWACAPLIRKIIEFHCAKAGLTFQSSILNDPGSDYYNLALFDLTLGEKGSYKDDSAAKREDVLISNAYLMTMIELISRISDLFEYEYKIIDNVLYIEPSAFFENLRTNKIGSSDACTEFSYDIQNRYAYGQFTYAEDYQEKEGQKAKQLYSQTLDWNSPPSPSQKGKLDRRHTFAPCRFMFDQFSYHKDGFFDMEGVLDELRDGPDKQLERFYGTDNIIRNYDICLSDDIIGLPKLVVLENNFNPKDARVIKKPYLKKGSKQYYIYNYPLLYKEEKDKVVNGQLVKGKPGQLTSFAETANPREKNDLLKIDSITYDCTCDMVDGIVSDFHKCYIDTPFGKGYPSQAKITFKDKNIEIALSDIKVICRR